MQTVSQVVTSADGCRLYAEAAGNKEKPAILFIHGIGVSSAWWRRQFDALSATFYCIRFDLRGHGASEKPSDPAAYRESKRWADDVAAIISAFGVNRLTVCVWSYGGFVLGDYLRSYGQEHVSGLVIIDTGLQLNTEQGGELIHPGAWEGIGKLFAPDMITYREGVENSVKLLTSDPLEKRDRADFLGAAFLVAPATWQAMFARQINNTDVFQSVSVPTLVVYGQQDQIYTPLAARQFIETIPRAQISYYSHGHAPFYEDTERFNMELAQFVKTVSSK